MGIFFWLSSTEPLQNYLFVTSPFSIIFQALFCSRVSVAGGMGLDSARDGIMPCWFGRWTSPIGPEGGHSCRPDCISARPVVLGALVRVLVAAPDGRGSNPGEGMFCFSKLDLHTAAVRGLLLADSGQPLSASNSRCPRVVDRGLVILWASWKRLR